MIVDSQHPNTGMPATPKACQPLSLRPGRSCKNLLHGTFRCRWQICWQQFRPLFHNLAARWRHAMHKILRTQPTAKPVLHNITASNSIVLRRDMCPSCGVWPAVCHFLFKSRFHIIHYSVLCAQIWRLELQLALSPSQKEVRHNFRLEA